jgi:hypothetical protein
MQNECQNHAGLYIVSLEGLMGFAGGGGEAGLASGEAGMVGASRIESPRYLRGLCDVDSG